MAGVRYYTPNQFEVDPNGVPLIGGQLFFYVTGTTTPLNTYSDSALTIANPNPVVADSNGRFGSIFFGSSQAYKVVLYGANPNPSVPSTPSNPQGSQIWTEDPCGPAAGGNQTVAGIIGEIRIFAGISSQIPSQWYLCYGQAVSRTTYAALYAVIGTTFGAGDGSTTFNLPDCRGRAAFGLDNMGGSAANRVTSGVSGVPGTTLGGSGGDQHAQTDTITSVSTVTDPGHLHQSIASGPANTDSMSYIEGGVAWDLQRNVPTETATTGITVATTSESGLTGSSQNMPPAIMFNMIIYAAA